MHQRSFVSVTIVRQFSTKRLNNSFKSDMVCDFYNYFEMKKFFPSMVSLVALKQIQKDFVCYVNANRSFFWHHQFVSSIYI